MAVMIGVDPHKGSHTAVAIDQTEQLLGELRVRSSADQVERLLSWAARWPKRTWAVEGAGGLGYLLAQQLVSAGETVLDVQPKLGSRVRLLATGNVNKNDPNDARSVAVAALRSKDVRPVAAEDHAAVLKLWSKRRRDLGSLRTQVACRLHSVLCDLVPGGHPKKEMTAAQATRALVALEPTGAVQAARHELAQEFLADLRRIDTQMREAKKRLEVAVKASGTTVTEVFGVGPYVAGTVLGYVVDVGRFADRDHFAAYNGTAPIEVSSGGHKVFRLSRRGNRRLNHAVHMAAVTQVRFRHSEGRAYYDRKVKEGKTNKEALRCLKRRISDAIFAHLVADAKRSAEAAKAGPGGQVGNGSVASVAGSHPAEPALRPSHSRASSNTRAPRRHGPAISTPTRPGKATSTGKRGSTLWPGAGSKGGTAK
jgi:transposase